MATENDVLAVIPSHVLAFRHDEVDMFDFFETIFLNQLTKCLASRKLAWDSSTTRSDRCSASR